ncbi:hypothetical protein D9M72_418850 [compost metagenome]
MHLPIPARAHDLRQCAGVVAIGLVGHRLHRGIRSPRLDADRRQAFAAQPIVKPGGQRARFQPDALQRKPDFMQHLAQRLRLARRTCFLDDPAALVDHTDRCRFQGHVQSGKVLHGCSFRCLWRINSTTFSHLDRSSRPYPGSAETPITPSDAMPLRQMLPAI